MGFGGTFVSFNTTLPTDRLAGSRGWIDTAGKPINDLASDWFSGGMIHPLFATAARACATSSRTTACPLRTSAASR
jgi:hypothetical protein